MYVDFDAKYLGLRLLPQVFLCLDNFFGKRLFKRAHLPHLSAQSRYLSNDADGRGLHSPFCLCFF